MFLPRQPEVLSSCDVCRHLSFAAACLYVIVMPGKRVGHTDRSRQGWDGERLQTYADHFSRPFFCNAEGNLINSVTGEGAKFLFI